MKTKSFIFRFALALGSFFISSNSFAQNSNLFKISGNGLDKPSYLMGTHHMICLADFAFPAKVENAIANTSQLALEVNFNDPAEMQSMQTMFTSGKKFSEIFTAEEITKLSSALSRFGIPIDGNSQYAKAVLVSLMSQLFVECDPQNTKIIDMLVMGKMTGKPTVGLETMAFQAAILEDIMTPKEIIESLDKIDENKETMKSLQTAYLTQDLKTLHELVTDTKYMYEKQQRAMLDDRNVKWIRPISAMAKEKPTLVAVGAGHLLGDKGLVTLLKEAGFTVEPVLD